MSHFSVCVAIPGSKLEGVKINGFEIESILDDIMEPYNEDPVLPEHTVFQDMTENCRETYEKDTDMAVLFPDGTVHSLRSKEFKDHFVACDGKIQERIDGRYAETDRSRMLKAVLDYPAKKLYSFEEYCREEFGYEEKDGRFGYWDNPDAHWDWYQIGGRYSNRLLVKKTAESALDPRDSVGGNYMTVNGARMGEIAWEENKRREHNAKVLGYEAFAEAYKSGDVERFGPMVSIREDGIYGWNVCLYKAGETLEEHLQRHGVSEDDSYPLCCYAYVDLEGKWNSKGDMGWFGISTNNKEERSWHDELQKFFASLGEDDFLVMVDCHI